MNGNRYIVEATAENFTPLVTGNSARGPALVYYWPQYSGPCMRLLPRLVKLADVFAGRFCWRCWTLMRTRGSPANAASQASPA